MFHPHMKQSEAAIAESCTQSIDQLNERIKEFVSNTWKLR